MEANGKENVLDFSSILSINRFMENLDEMPDCYKLDEINDSIYAILLCREKECAVELGRLVNYASHLDQHKNYCKEIPNWIHFIEYIYTHLQLKTECTVLFVQLLHILLCICPPSIAFMQGKETLIFELLKGEATIQVLNLIEQAIELECFDAKTIMEKDKLNWIMQEDNIYGIVLMNFILESKQLSIGDVVKVVSFYIKRLEERLCKKDDYAFALINGLYDSLDYEDNDQIFQMINASHLTIMFEHEIRNMRSYRFSYIAWIMLEISLFNSKEIDLCNLLLSYMKQFLSSEYIHVIRECIERLLNNKIESWNTLLQIYKIDALHALFYNISKYGQRAMADIASIELLAFWNEIDVPIVLNEVLDICDSLQLDADMRCIVKELTKIEIDD